MEYRFTRVVTARRVALALSLAAAPSVVGAQDRLKTMPGYEQYARVAPQIVGSVKLGTLQAFWIDTGNAFEYQRDNKWYRYDVATRKAGEISAPTVPDSVRRGRFGGRGGVERGRQVASTDSPDGKRKAFYRDRNLWVSNADGSDTSRVTTDGSEKDRIKYGTASWVYGEELGQTTAMWWSPDGSKLAYYRFDESKVPDYFLQLDQTKVQSTVDTEAYPKAGAPNPIVDLFVYDVASKKSVKIDVRDGKPFDNGVVGHYVYRVGWSPDGREVTFNRTNRRQNVMELTACAPSTGACRVVVHEEWTPSWVSNRPTIQFLSDKKRFLWESERTGFRNYYLYDFSGKLLGAVTNHSFEVAGIVRVDEKANALYYMARDGDNHMKLQLHRVGLDGKGDRRLTDPTVNHSVTFSPDGKHFVDVVQTHDKAPRTVIATADGKQVAEIASSDVSKYQQLGLRATGALHVRCRGWQDAAAWNAARALELRLDEEVSGARVGVRRAGDQWRTRDVLDAIGVDGVRVHRRVDRLAQRRRSRQAVPRRDLPKARHRRDRRSGRGREVVLGPARTSIAIASASTAHRTAAMRRGWRCCVIPMCSRQRRRHRR